MHNIRTKARIAGVLYLVIMVTAMFAEVFVRMKLVNLSDAPGTAAKIIANESLYRLGAASMLIALLCDVVVAVLLYEVLKPAGRTLSALAAMFRLVDVAVIGINLFNHFEALFLIEGGEVAAAMAALRTYAYGFNIGMVFFAVNLLFLGILIFKSRLLPRAVGVLLMMAAAAYVINSLILILSPDFTNRLFPILMAFPFIAELSLAVWLAAAGADAERWNELTHKEKTCTPSSNLQLFSLF